MEERPCLLFCDTFHHADQQDGQPDLIAFPSAYPVIISEIRVIPQGCKVHPQIRDKLGETHPAAFNLKLYAISLAKQSPRTFESLGEFEYEEGKSIQLITNTKIPTNLVFLRGCYRSLTVCIYGTFAKYNQPRPGGEQPIKQPMPVELQPHLPIGAAPIVMASMPQQVHIPAQQPMELHPSVPRHHIPFPAPAAVFPQQSPRDDRRDPREDYRRRRDDDVRDRLRDRGRHDRFDDERRSGGGRRDYNDRDYSNREGSQDRCDDKPRYREERAPSTPPHKSNQDEQSNGPRSLVVSQTSDKESKPPSKPNATGSQIDYEDIESDDDGMLDDFTFDDTTLPEDFDDSNETLASFSLNFIPYQCILDETKTQSTTTAKDNFFGKLVKSFDENSSEPAEVKQLQDYIVSDTEAERDAKWVTKLEELPNVFPAAMAYFHSLAQKTKEKYFVSVLAEWAVFALSMKRARALPLAVNIRFIKAGVKLTTLLADCCEEYQRYLVELDVHEKLIDLLSCEHMASSIKLVIFKALDATTNSAYGMDALFNWTTERACSVKRSVYSRLLVYLLEQTNVRVIAAIKPLLQKAHFYEAAAKLQTVTSRIAQSAPPKAVGNKPAEDQGQTIEENPTTTSTNAAEEKQKMAVDVDISNQDMSDLLVVIQTIHKTLEHGNNFIRQPSLHSFPTTVRLAENSTGEDCYPVILDLLSSRRFLESILVLVSSPLFCETELYSSIRDLLLFLMSNNKGLLYLLSNAEVCNGLIRALLHFSADEAGDLSEMPTLKQYRMNVDTAERCMPHNLGLLLVYHLQAMQEADKLLKKPLQDLEVSEMDDSENVSVLHMLYSMTFSSIGRDSVTSVLSYGPNVMCLLPFLTGGDNFETKMKKSVSSRYAAVLLQMTLKYSEEVHWLSQFKQRLLSIPRKENDKVHDEIHHLVSPLEKLTTFDIHAITPLVEFIKVELEDMKLGTGSPCSVLVCLRLLTRLMQSDVKDSQQVDLQQQLHVIEMFSANAMEIFISLFKKINEQLLLPWKQQQPVSNESCLVLVNMTQHSISLTQSLMQHLLITTFCFKDSRLVQEMFTLHKILCSRPPVGLFATVLAKLHDDIINVLLMFIKGTRQAPESQEAVKKGTWFILLKELLTFLVAKPENFVTGLVLLSELLPTPLPVYSLVELRESEITKVMNERYLCMTNLSCLREELKQMLTTVVGSCCSVLQYYLRRALCQIIDLGSAVATIIIRTLCEMVNEGIAKSEKEEENVEEKKEEESSSSKKFLSGFIYNSFSLLSYLVCQPAGKCVFLQILAETEPETGACQFADFIPKLISVHIRENDFAYLGNNLLPLFRSMCDHEVCMDEQDCDVTAQHLANSLPGHANCVTIVSMLYNMLLDDKHPLPIVLRSLNILESLTDHDYGMSVMKQHLLTQGDCLNVLLARLIKEVEEKKEAPVVYNTVSRFFTYLNLINSSGPDDFMKAAEEMKVDKTEDEEEEEDVKPDIGSANVEDEKKVNIEDTNNPLKRKIIVNASTLKKIFKFDKKNISDHPMKKLESMLEENTKEDEELSQLCEAVNTFRMILIASVDLESPQEKDESKVVLLPAESAHSQFGGRMKNLLLNNIDDERATTNDWFDEPAPDEIDSDTESDTLKIDLLEIATKFLPAFNFQEEVEKGFVDTTETKRAQRSKRDGFYKAGQHIDDAKRLRFDVSALNSGGGTRGGARGGRGGGGRGFYNKPSYNNRGFGGRGGSRGFGGRGRGRGRGAGGNSDIDSFRLRRQNTSRPPSMHVDDFMNMEKGGQTVMAQEGDTSSPQNERFSSSFNSPQQNNTRWTNSFRRSNDGGRSNNYNDNFNQRNYGGGGGGRFHQRSKSDWNNSNYRGGGGRDYRSNRGGGDGGYWNNKSKDDSRFQSSYRNNRGNGNRHQRTFTR